MAEPEVGRIAYIPRFWHSCLVTATKWQVAVGGAQALMSGYVAWSVAKVDKEITASNIGDGMNGIRADGSTGRAVCQALEEAMRERGVPPDGQLTP